jgi:hypothetical protein
MNKITIFIFVMASALFAIGQSYEPQILILSPNEFIFDKSFEKEIQSKNIELSSDSKISDKKEFIASEEFKKEPENIQAITLSEFNFLKNLNFSNQVSYIAHQYLAYRFYERFKNLIILLTDKKSDSNIQNLKNIADEEKIQYILNFSNIKLYKKGRKCYSKISVQLYDNYSKNILLNSEFEGDWTNPGFEFACKEKSIECPINNAISKALSEVINIVAKNSPTLNKQKELNKNRFNELLANYYSKNNDLSFLKPIIPQPDSNILLNNQFQIIVDSNRTKFVAFFIEQVSNQDFKSMKQDDTDKNINIISSKDIKDGGFLSEIPQIYAYIVKGVKHKEKWYYEKSNVTYFDAKSLEEGKQKYFYNLAKWNFFKDNSTEFNNNFWETYLFTKVESTVTKKKDEIEEIKSQIINTNNSEDKEIYQKMIDDYYIEDIKNKEYFGLYEIVADQLREEKRKKDEQSTNFIRTEFLPQFYLKYCKTNSLVGINKLNGNDIPLIFPSDKSIFLSPILLDLGKENKELHYFVLKPNGENSFAIYKWNYFAPIKPQYGNMYGQEINEQLNQITKWNFSFDTLDDFEFWEKYVLLKTGENFKYLTKIQ